MNAADSGSRQWDEAATHLVQAHGAEPGLMLPYTYGLGELRWVHFDTHAALEIARSRPPDRHVHAALPDPAVEPVHIREPGAEYPRAAHPDPDTGFPIEFYRPFNPSPFSGGGHAPTYGPRFQAIRQETTLPQTEMNPDYAGGKDLTGRWADVALTILRDQLQAHGEPDCGLTIAEFRREIKDFADAVAARWLAGTNFPAGPLGPGAAPLRAAPQPGQQVPRRSRRR